MIAGTEDQGGPKARDLGDSTELKQCGFRLGLAAQVMAACVTVGTERTHLQEPGDVMRVAGGHQLLRQPDVRPLESLLVEAGLVEDADQVDHDIHALGVAHEGLFFMNVGLHQVQGRENQQGTMAKPLPCQDPYLVTLRHQAVDQCPADETGAPQNAYPGHGLIIMRRNGLPAMLLHIPEVLNPEEREKIRAGLRRGTFADGRASAGRLAGEVKQNEEFQASRSEREPLELCVAQALQRHPMVRRHALPLRISHPIFSRYQPGMHYGWHTDDAVMGEGGYRSDLAVTVFLSEPSEYEGGALVVKTPYGEQSARYPAGDAVLYPAGRLHRVEEVTAGERWVAVLWIQSQVRDEQQREILQTLDALRSQGMEENLEDDELARLDWVYSRLLRMWADV